MLADKVRPPWKAAVALAGTFAASSQLAQQPCATRTVPAPGPTAQVITPHEPSYVHVKLAAEGVRLAALDAMGAQVMFTHLDPGTHDDRVLWRRIEAPSLQDAEALARQLATDFSVEQVYVVPAITLPSVTSSDRPHRLTDDGESCPITTPSFESYQGYLAAAPQGIDAPAAWRRGQRGGGVWFADIEGGWNAAHEDLPGDRIRHVAGQPIRDPAWRAHGTAVLGEVVGRDNAKGVVGIAPDVERVFTSSIGGISVANAIDTAAKELRAGDVLLIELQMSGPRGNYIAVEYYDDNYAAIHAATKRGVVVIEAAGNGNEDLDHAAYKKKFDRQKRDSGAIIVGAGAPPRPGFADRERLDFSNYGSRVDVQGWGRKVATLDYGDLQACDGEERSYSDRHYTGEFSGTSSASPIVAGAAVLLEGFARERGKVLTPVELREMLRRTGTPQAGDTRKAIGPRPDLARAFASFPAALPAE